MDDSGPPPHSPVLSGGAVLSGEAAVRASEQRFRTALINSPVIVALL
jgi:hypothetical protein